MLTSERNIFNLSIKHFQAWNNTSTRPQNERFLQEKHFPQPQNKERKREKKHFQPQDFHKKSCFL